MIDSGNTSLASHGLWQNDCIKRPSPMDVSKIRQHLANIPGWTIVHEQGNEFLERMIPATSAEAARELQEKILAIANEQDHHPEEGGVVTGNTLTLRFRTHSAKGITLNDLIMAAKTNRLLADGTSTYAHG